MGEVHKILNAFKDRYCNNGYDIDENGNLIVLQGEGRTIISNFVFIINEVIYTTEDDQVILSKIILEGVAKNSIKLPRTTINVNELSKKKWITDMYTFGDLGDKPNKNYKYLLSFIENSIDIAPKIIEFKNKGWYRFKEQWFYLYSEGDIHIEGNCFKVKLEETVFKFTQNKTITPKEAFLQSLELLNLCDNKVTYSLLSYNLASVLVTPLSVEMGIIPSFSMWLFGKTGLGKTQLATLFTKMSNNENLIFVDAFKNDLKKANKNNKDSVLIIDDFGTSKTKRDEKLTFEKVERFIRALSDNSNSLANTINPQGLFLFTGEKYLDLDEKTESTSKRTIRIKMDNIFNRNEKGYCEEKVKNFNHFYEGAFLQTSVFHYISWLTNKINRGLLSDYKMDFERLRMELLTNDHPRIIESISHLIIAFNYYIAYGKDQGFITQQQSIDYCNKAKAIFYEVMDEQQKPVLDPLIQLFFDTLTDLINEKQIVIFQEGDITWNGEINNDKKIYGKMDLAKRSLLIQWEKILEIADQHIENHNQYISLLSKSKTLGKKLKDQKFIKVRAESVTVTIQKQVVYEGKINRGRFIEFNTDKIPEVRDLIIEKCPLPDLSQLEDQYNHLDKYNKQYSQKGKRRRINFVHNGKFEQY